MFWRRPRWRIVVVGHTSGSRIRLDFVTFRDLQEALDWCVRMNGRRRKGIDGLDEPAYMPERIR